MTTGRHSPGGTQLGQHGEAAGRVAREQPVVVPLQPLTLLVDDVRSFRDGRPCLVARSSAVGVLLVRRFAQQRIEHLWLDHDLAGEDTIWPVIRLLEDAALADEPYDIGLVHIHAARSGPAHQMGVALRRADYRVVRSYDLRLWCR